MAEDARDAELASLEEDRLQGLADAALLRQEEEDRRRATEGRRTQEEQISQEVKDLIDRAEQALADDNPSLAATLGRQAAVGLLDSTGGWTQQAAQFALAGTDADVHGWLEVDRVAAQHQDDRETALYLAEVSTPAVAAAARLVLESDDIQATHDFLTGGATEAAADDLRVTLFRVLTDDPGSAVRAAAEAALADGSPRALQHFFDVTYPEALVEDDGVLTASLISGGGPYTRAYAEAAMAGTPWMRRNFVAKVRYATARLDHDFATHREAIAGAIAAAAKIAEKAQEDAARAQEAAAQAREAAEEAAEWASRARASAERAAGHAAEAREHADAADRSAAAARESAQRAAAAARTAQRAARRANFSANSAMASARTALRHAYNAQASANSARQSALDAGQAAREAATAASQARRIAARMRHAEMAAAAQRAEEEARRQRENGTDPSDHPDHDDIDDNDNDNGWKDPAWWAETTSLISNTFGIISLGATLGALLTSPTGVGAPILGMTAIITGGISALAGAASAVFVGMDQGFTSFEFAKAAGWAMIGIVTWGQGSALTALGRNWRGISRVASTVTQSLLGSVPIVGGLLG
ncbi:ALF repeat-containing protein [Streptomyces marincola]|nr:ALF repeat-containing protein [Streptomyces marincola]